MTVGTAFYQQVNGPLFIALIFVMGIGPLLAWRRASRRACCAQLPLARAGRRHRRRSRCPSWACVASGRWSGFAICAFSGGHDCLRGLARHARAPRPWRGLSRSALAMLFNRHRQRYGGYLVHLGLIVLAVGVIGSQFFQSQREALLKRAESHGRGLYAHLSRASPM